MIQRLSIRNYAIIEHLEMDFSNKLTIITGETGAGKSILLGALGMILGNRADTKVLYKQTEKCVIEGYFNIAKYDLKPFFEAHEIDYETESVVRRELTPAGKSRTFINDTPVNLNTLRQFTGALVDLHQQFDTLDMHEVSFQIRMVDALADNKKLLGEYQILYKKFQENKRQLAQLVKRNENSAREMDFIHFQLVEFDKAELIAGEQERLEIEMTQLNHSETIKRTLGAAFQALNEVENSIVGQLQTVIHGLAGVKKYGHAILELHQRLEGLTYELQDVGDECETIAESTEYDGERIAEMQARLDVIYRLQKKHHLNSVEQLLEIEAQLRQQLTSFSDLKDEIVLLETILVEQSNDLKSKAAELSQRRQAAIPAFEQKIHEMLHQLSMEHARLKIQILENQELTTTGSDHIEFLFAANKGSRFQPIREVASGGELSRLTLCTKSLVAAAIPLPTLIFDEIDSGVSGDVALKMGNILQALSAEHQVVAITHSPQVAAKADAHYFVYKKHLPERTVTHVRLLTKEEKIRSIATMLSQNPPTHAAIQNAKELLGLKKVDNKMVNQELSF
jgi:DNA repair protein RecN (Recombination protein N)